MWDLTTALDFFNKNEKSDYSNQPIQTGTKLGIHSDHGGPTTQELVRISENTHCYTTSGLYMT